MSRFIGIVSAYAYAVSQGYTGTEEEYAELMASYASTAQTAIEAADRAVEANTAAQSAKTDASASKTAAQTAAQTATTAASEASQSASTATTKASEASQSASTASAAATSASTSAQTATTATSTATTKASEAAASEAAALSAKTDAETARDAAAQSASEAAASAESIDPENIFSAYPTDTASGAVATFPDGADDIPMKSCVVHIEPVQDLSHGDPSPDNICPISGWTGCNVVRTGKNVANCINGKGIDIIGNITDETARIATVDAIMIDSTQSYCISYVEDTDFRALYCVYKNGEMIRRNAAIRSGAVLNVQDGDSVRFCIYDDKGTRQASVENQKPQLELGSIASNYTPFTGSSTYPITFPTEAGTVYGGTLDVTTGLLTVTMAEVDLGTLTWDKKVSGVFYSWSLRNLVKAVVTSQIANAKCTTLKIGTYDDVYFNARLDNAISVGGDSQLGARCSAFANENEFKSAMSGVQLVYELATPQTYQLTPTEIRSLLGINNVWADTGDSIVTYRADTTMYINRKIAEAVSALS